MSMEVRLPSIHFLLAFSQSELQGGPWSLEQKVQRQGRNTPWTGHQSVIHWLLGPGSKWKSPVSLMFMFLDRRAIEILEKTCTAKG